MNKYQEAIESINFNATKAYSDTCYCVATKGSMMKIEQEIKDKTDVLKPLVDKTTPKKPIKLEIIDLDEIIMPEYTNTIDKYMCDNCGLTWFIVDGHTYQHKYCKQCGQAILWKD